MALDVDFPRKLLLGFESHFDGVRIALYVWDPNQAIVDFRSLGDFLEKQFFEDNFKLPKLT